jgi:hypothetical protein
VLRVARKYGRRRLIGFRKGSNGVTTLAVALLAGQHEVVELRGTALAARDQVVDGCPVLGLVGASCRG